jgi:hypothetical protein
MSNANLMDYGQLMSATPNASDVQFLCCRQLTFDVVDLF